MSDASASVQVIIVGAGEVGSYLAKIFVEESHDVSVVEADERLARELEDSLDALVIHGSGVNREVLDQARLHKADLFVAVTQVDEVNLISCMTARKFGNPTRTIARVRDMKYLLGESSMSTEDLGIDHLVSPEYAVADRIVGLLEFEGTGEIRQLADGRLVLLELPLGAASPLVNKPVAHLSETLPSPCLIAAVYDAQGVRIPTGTDVLKENDRADIITTPANIDQMLVLSGKPWHRVKHVLIIGCGTIGLHLAKTLEERGVYPTVVEIDRERAKQVSLELSRSIVLNADGTDTNFLTEQLQETADAVVVLLEDDNQAMLTGLFAKHLGAKKVLVRADELAYAPIAHNVGIDALVSPRRALANAILRFLRRGRVESAVMLGDNGGEVLTVEVPEAPKNKKLVESPLCQIDFPDGMLIGAIIRGDQVQIAQGETVLKPHDRVLVVAQSKAIAAAEELFR